MSKKGATTIHLIALFVIVTSVVTIISVFIINSNKLIKYNNNTQLINMKIEELNFTLEDNLDTNNDYSSSTLTSIRSLISSTCNDIKKDESATCEIIDSQGNTTYSLIVEISYSIDENTCYNQVLISNKGNVKNFILMPIKRK